LENLNVHSISVEEDVDTPDAKMDGTPARVSLTVAPFWKLLPLIVVLTVAELPPYIGETPDIAGASPDGVTETVTKTVGVMTGIEEI